MQCNSVTTQKTEVYAGQDSIVCVDFGAEDQTLQLDWSNPESLIVRIDNNRYWSLSLSDQIKKLSVETCDVDGDGALDLVIESPAFQSAVTFYSSEYPEFYSSEYPEFYSSEYPEFWGGLTVKYWGE